MSMRTIQFRLGMGAICLSVFLLLYGIPNWVTAPANIPRIVLSPVFWPTVLAGILAMVGAGLLFAATRCEKTSSQYREDLFDRLPEYGRLLALALLMVATVYALPRLGMVWTSMLTIVVIALLVRTRHPGTVLLCAVIVPLVLYFFFAHVAGVAIPQGNFVRLP